MSTFIQNATIVSAEIPAKAFIGSIFVDRGLIQKIIPGLWMEEHPYNQADEVVRADGMLVIPGMINAHYHSYSNLLKGTESNLPLELWSLYTVAYGHSLQEEDIYLSVLLGAGEMMKNGITGCIDHFPHISRSHAALRAYEKTNMRVSFAPMMHDIPDHQFLSIRLPQNMVNKLESAKIHTPREMELFYQQLLCEWQHKNNSKIKIVVGPNAPQRCSSEMLKVCKKLSQENDLSVHTHLLETKIQRDVGDKKLDGILNYLKEHGLVNPKLSVAHAVWLTEEDMELLNEANTTIVHNPNSNMILGSGRASIGECVNKGIDIALGTDASNCGTQHNLLETMRSAIMMNRLYEPDYTKWLQVDDMFRMVTQNGAKAMGHQQKTGVIREGYCADLVLLNTNNTIWSPENNVISQLVFHENGRSINSVMIDGKWTVRQGKIVSFDEDEVILKVKERSIEMFQACKESLTFAEELLPYYKNMYQSHRLEEKLK
ncbi:amidohydrolase family protein [Neobacillus soli]|uniref:amidohydrolase family protein n=1 Tax=Neobacillus soli TaxID=220688 RepID=UPI00082577FB|nr:amidohydrolase family protein [Neobacillus soli]